MFILPKTELLGGFIEKDIRVTKTVETCMGASEIYQVPIRRLPLRVNQTSTVKSSPENGGSESELAEPRRPGRCSPAMLTFL